MSRHKMPVTLDDLRVLARLVQSDSRKLSAAARELNVERTYLYRLIERCDDLLETLRDGPTVDWREGTHFRPPAELRRLARSMEILTADWYDYPVIAAGATAGSIVEGILDRHRHLSGRFRMAMGVQTEEALQGLATDVFDLAIVQQGTGIDWRDASTPGIDDGAFAHRELLPWRAVVVRARVTRSSSLDSIEWQTGSFAHVLSHRVMAERGEFATRNRQRSARSYADALLMARHGHPVAFVIPDIYLSKSDEEVIQIQETNVVGRLVGVFRQAEEDRLAPFLESAVWRR